MRLRAAPAHQGFQATRAELLVEISQPRTFEYGSSPETATASLGLLDCQITERRGAGMPVALIGRAVGCRLGEANDATPAMGTAIRPPYRTAKSRARRPRRRQPPFLRRVRIRGYKSIAFCDVTLEPLTVLVGRTRRGRATS